MTTAPAAAAKHAVLAAAPIHPVRLVPLGQGMLARQVGDPIPPRIGFGFWETSMPRPESVAGK